MILLEPFQYDFMWRAIWVSALVGGCCAFLSCFLILKGWSLLGDAMSHSVVPGVAGAYLLGFPYAAGAFLTAILAALAMALIGRFARLREDAVIGVVFITFFAAGLMIISVFPTPISVNNIIFGNILAIADEDLYQVLLIALVTACVMLLVWRNLLVVFFDEVYAQSIGLPTLFLKGLFFVLLGACTVAGMQTVGAILVVAMVITPAATAYLVTDRFSVMLCIAVLVGTITCAVGAWLSYFIDGSTGGVIVSLQTLICLLALVFAPRHGWLAHKRLQRQILGAMNP